MLIDHKHLPSLTIRNVKGLDPVTVIWDDPAPGCGQVWISCFGAAWAGYWGAMGEGTVRAFFCDCSTDYLANRLMLRGTKKEIAYLTRVVVAVQEAFKADIDAQDAHSKNCESNP